MPPIFLIYKEVNFLRVSWAEGRRAGKVNHQNRGVMRPAPTPSAQILIISYLRLWHNCLRFVCHP